MTDWSDEVRARLVREEERLRYKAANLQARGKTVMAAQELVVADDIRAALEEIERANKALDDIFTMEPCPKCGHGITRGCYGCDLKAAEAEVERLERDRAEVIAALGPLAHPGLSPAANVVELRKRAEAAEAKLAEAQREPYRVLWAALEQAGITRGDGCPDTILVEEVQSLRAKVERLRGLPDEIEADAKGLALGETFSGGPLDGVSVYNVMMWAVRRIRAALRGGGE